MLVFVPLTRVLGSVKVSVSSYAVHAVVGPYANVSIAIDVDVAPISILLVVEPVALILAPVLQD